MTQLEIILNGIEEVRNSGIQCPLENVEPHRCFHFPEELIDDIVSLLKAQEARLLTLDEVMAHNNQDGCVWIQWRSNSVAASFIFTEDNWVKVSSSYQYKEPKFTWVRNDNYGKTWICWTSRPTDEQREAVKW